MGTCKPLWSHSSSNDRNRTRTRSVAKSSQLRRIGHLGPKSSFSPGTSFCSSCQPGCPRNASSARSNSAAEFVWLRLKNLSRTPACSCRSFTKRSSNSARARLTSSVCVSLRHDSRICPSLPAIRKISFASGLNSDVQNACRSRSFSGCHSAPPCGAQPLKSRMK